MNKKSVFTLIIICTTALSCFAGNEGLMTYYALPAGSDSLQWMTTPPTLRKTIDLNGVWQASVTESGQTFDASVPGYYLDNQEVVFNRTFVLDSSFLCLKLQLVALGVANQCRVFLNDRFLASHVGGQAPFTVSLPSDLLVKDGVNLLRIIVDNRLKPRSGIPLKFSPGIPQNYGGIFREIYIEALPAFSLRDLHIKPILSDDIKKNQLGIDLRLDKSDDVSCLPQQGAIDLLFELQDQKGKPLTAMKIPIVLPEAGFMNIADTLSVKSIELWSPNKPVIYKLKTALRNNGKIIDEIVRDVNFFSLSLDSGKVILNGVPTALKGIVIYEQFPETGPLATVSAIIEQIDRIKYLGANSVRIAGAPPHPYFLDACNQKGLMVFFDCPFSFVPPIRLANPVFRESVRNYVDEIIEMYRKYPAWIGLGLGMDWQNSDNDFVALTANKFKKNSDKLTYLIAGNNYYVNNSIDLIFDNPAKSDYTPALQKEHDFVRIPTIGLPLEIEGAEGVDAKVATPEKTIVDAEERQAYFLNRNLSNFMSQPGIGGVFVTSLFDWRGDFTLLSNGLSDDLQLNTNGLYTADGRERIAASVVHAAFTEGKTLKISVSPIQRSNPNIFPLTGIAVILIFLIYFNRNRRFRSNIRRAFTHSHGLYSEIRENRKASGEYIFILAILSILSMAVFVASFLHHFRRSELFENFINFIIPAQVVKEAIVLMAWQPTVGVAATTGSLFLSVFIFIVLLKLLALLFGNRQPFWQFFALVFWSAASVLWLLPLTPIYYRVLSQTEWQTHALAFLGIIIAWTFLRLFRAIRIVLFLSIIRSTFIFILAGSAFCVGLVWYLDLEIALLDYMPVYWEIVKSYVIIT